MVLSIFLDSLLLKDASRLVIAEEDDPGLGRMVLNWTPRRSLIRVPHSFMDPQVQSRCPPDKVPCMPASLECAENVSRHPDMRKNRKRNPDHIEAIETINLGT